MSRWIATRVDKLNTRTMFWVGYICLVLYGFGASLDPWWGLIPLAVGALGYGILWGHVVFRADAGREAVKELERNDEALQRIAGLPAVLEEFDTELVAIDRGLADQLRKEGFRISERADREATNGE